MKVALVALNKPGNYALALHYLEQYSLADSELSRVVRFSVLQADVDVSSKWMVARILASRPDLVGFSCNIWNVRRSLKIARLLKRINPRLVVAIGGQEATRSSIPYLAENTCLDLLVDGEGEEVFRQVLRRYALRGGQGLEEVAGLQFRVDGQIRVNPPAPPIEDLNSIPSPYLNGAIRVDSNSHLGARNISVPAGPSP